MARTIEVFKFTELDAEVQDEIIERARERRAGQEAPWASEWRDTLDAFCKIFPVSWRSFDIDNFHCQWTWTGCTGVANYDGEAAWEWLQEEGIFDIDFDNVPLTGFCGDCDILEPLKKFKENPDSVPDLRQVVEDCISSWMSGYRQDVEYHQSEECVREYLENDDQEYTEDGREI